MRIISFVAGCLLLVGCKDTTGQFEKLADQACECAMEDSTCGNKVLGDVVKFAESHSMSDGNANRINAAGKKLNECLMNTGVREKELTSALEKMVD